jgi:hypothetical protein
MTSFFSLLPVMAAVALSACASEGHPTPAAATVAAPAVHAQSQRIFLDPVTGEARAPTAEERRQMQRTETAVPAKSLQVPQVIHYPNGMTGVRINRPLNQVHAEITKDGDVHSYCNDEPAAKDQP